MWSHPPVLEVQGERALFGCVYPREIVDRLGPLIEKDMVMWLARARELTKYDWVPIEVHLQTPATDPAEYARFFRAPVRNDASGCWLIFDAALLALPIVGGEGTLRTYLQPIADRPAADSAADRKDARAFASRVRASIARLIQSGSCSVEDVARELAVSPRTLQRRLEREGTTFGEVFDETRRAAALECLRNPRVAIKDAAYRVGFSEPSTFYRAFRRWTGATPANYRRSLAIRASAV